MHPRPDRGDRRREEGVDRRGRRLPGKRTVLEGTALGLQGPWPGDRALAGDRRRGVGVWKAIGQVLPSTRGQCCWVHKSATVLDKLPKGGRPKAMAALHAIYEAETRVGAEKAFDLFVATYQAKYPKAPECLTKDRQALLSFYDFPAEHWRHIRTTNPIEATFATVRLRTVKTRGAGAVWPA